MGDSQQFTILRQLKSKDSWIGTIMHTMSDLRNSRSKQNTAQPACSRPIVKKGLKNLFTQPRPLPAPPRHHAQTSIKKKREINEICTPRKPSGIHVIFQFYREIEEPVRSEKLLKHKLAKSIGDLQARSGREITISKAQSLEIGRLLDS